MSGVCVTSALRETIRLPYSDDVASVSDSCLSRTYRHMCVCARRFTHLAGTYSAPLGAAMYCSGGSGDDADLANIRSPARCIRRCPDANASP
ncbi:hypothetical protein MRX96_038595 [Rhipicephalus microplus]